MPQCGRIAASWFAVAAAGALAQEPPVQRIEVTGHYENGVGTSDAASQGSITARLIEARPVLRPGEILELVPGVVVTQHSGDGKANQYFLRGFNLDHGTDFATWVDGMPVNMPTHAHGQGYSDVNFLIPELVRRIDYLKGPYFAREGDFSSAGAARVSLFDRLASNVAFATLGENGYRRGLLAGSGDAAGGALTGALDLVQNDGPWATPEGLRKWSALLRYVQGDAAAGWSATAMGYQARWHATDQVPLRAVESGALGRFDAVDPTDAGDTARYSASFNLHRLGERSAFEASAYAIRSRLDLFSNFTYFLDDPLHGDQFEQSERRTAAGGELRQRWTLALAGIDMMHTLGLQARRDRLDPVALYKTEARQRLATTREDRVTQESGAAYYENAARWTNWLRTVAGVRLDTYRFDVASSLPANSGRVNDRIASPKLSAVFGPFGKWELFANWGRGFHSNDARGTTITVDPVSGAPASRVTPLVRSTGSELGLRAEPVPGLQSSLALWQLDLASELLFVGDAGTTQPSRPSRRYGIEWNNHYVAARHLLLDLDVAASHARFRDGDPVGSFIPGALDRMISFGATLADFGPWSASLHLRYFGPRPLVEDNSVRSSPTILASARVSYRASREWTLALDVFNLFDRRASDIDYYYASRLRGEPAAGVNDIHFHPVEPRTIRLTATLRF
jgi:outer membrane receptor protein involved in Fe transport